MMNQKLKRGVSVGLSAIMLLSLCSGCAGTAKTNPETKQKNGVVEIRMVHMLNPEMQLDPNPVLDLIEEKLGIRLIIEAPPVNDYWERCNVKVATGDMPDFFLNGTDVNFEKWSKEGLIADITEDIKNYPNLMKNITKEQWGDTTALHDGRIYGVPRVNSYDQWGYIINTEWLDKVNMEIPATVDDFEKVCRAFTTQDPDGNGKNDTFGASFGTDQSGSIWNLYNDFFSTAYRLSQHVGMPDIKGEYHLKQYSAQYYDYMNQVRKMYEEGIIDKEFITHKNEEYIEKFAQNRVGIIGASSKRYMTDIIEKYGLDPSKYQYCAPLVLNQGEKPSYVMPPSNWCAFLINAKSDKKEAILKLIDWANSEEGFIATHLGIQGVNYNSYDLETRTVDRTEEQKVQAQKAAGDMFGFANAYEGRSLIEGGLTPETTKLWKENVERVNANVQNMYVPFIKCFFSMQGEFPDELQMLATLETRYVTGEIKEEELRNFSENELQDKIKSYTDEYVAFMKEHPVTIK